MTARNIRSFLSRSPRPRTPFILTRKKCSTPLAASKSSRQGRQRPRRSEPRRTKKEPQDGVFGRNVREAFERRSGDFGNGQGCKHARNGGSGLEKVT